MTLRSQTDFATGKLNHVPAVSDSETFGFGIRVLAGGAWGFSASHLVTKDEIARAAKEAVGIAKANAPLLKEPVRLAPVAAYTDTYATPIAKDPFAVPVAEKLDLLRRASEEAKKVAGVFSTSGFIAQRVEHRFFASTEGSVITQTVFQISPEFSATAVERGRKTKTRTTARTPRRPATRSSRARTSPATRGASARRSSNHLKAPSVAPGKKDLVLLPTHLGLTIHESIGHSTELDRALGFEANFAGTSFLTTDKLGTFRVGADIVSFNGDRIRKESLSTCGWDDDGVKTRQFPIIKNGIFVGYQTIRDQAHRIGQKESMGCCYADSYASVPFQRMPNVWLEPGQGRRDAPGPRLGRRRRHPDRRPRLVLDRPPALQLPVRRRRVLGDQGREGRRR